MAKKHLTPEEFVTLWQKATDSNDFKRLSGMTMEAARARAKVYISRGVPLKKMPRAASNNIKPLDVEKLKALCNGTV